jgi:divinyl protochlorophyllide a 8-vinyl-reductase
MQRDAEHPADRIGPNAILRVMEVLQEDQGEDVLGAVMARAGLDGYLACPPDAMVSQDEVTALHEALRGHFSATQYRGISREAGLRTGDYLLANRIPAPAQWLLRRLPRALAARALLAAITRNAWTFAGTAHFTARAGNPHRLTLGGCKVCQGATDDHPLCDYYAATFERLFRVLVDPRLSVVETRCQAQGHPACVFEVARR